MWWKGEAPRIQGKKRRSETERERVQRGNMGRSKGYFRVNPLLDCLRAGGCQQAWEQTPTNVTQGLVYMQSFAAVHTHSWVYTQRGRRAKHIIITDENTKINVINMLASEEISPCFLSNLHPSTSCIFSSFIPHTSYSWKWLTVSDTFLAWVAPVGITSLSVAELAPFFWVAQGFNTAWSCWVTCFCPISQ